MDETQTTCPHCGKPVAANLMGLCPQCMLKAGMATQSVGPAGGEPFVPPTVDELGRHFPALEILELIGRGGMGAVYKARQKSLDRVVALKILPPLAGEDEKQETESKKKETAFAERFAREAKALAALSHPHIVTLYEFGEADGFYYFLMEYVDGVNLRQLLNAGKLAPKEALAIVPQICDALQYAHDRGIVHRDIKPENILLSRDGVVKIADFGVAKIVGGRHEGEDHRKTVGEGVVGTPAYMAPEQKDRSGEVDHRADIYSLGVVFYQMLTGELPGKQIEAPSRKVLVDVRIDEIVLRALEKEPERRYETAGVMKTEVETVAAAPGNTREQKRQGTSPGAQYWKWMSNQWIPVKPWHKLVVVTAIHSGRRVVNAQAVSFWLLVGGLIALMGALLIGSGPVGRPLGSLMVGLGLALMGAPLFGWATLSFWSADRLVPLDDAENATLSRPGPATWQRAVFRTLLTTAVHLCLAGVIATVIVYMMPRILLNLDRANAVLPAPAQQVLGVAVTFGRNEELGWALLAADAIVCVLLARSRSRGPLVVWGVAVSAILVGYTVALLLVITAGILRVGSAAPPPTAPVAVKQTGDGHASPASATQPAASIPVVLETPAQKAQRQRELEIAEQLQMGVALHVRQLGFAWESCQIEFVPNSSISVWHFKGLTHSRSGDGAAGAPIRGTLVVQSVEPGRWRVYGSDQLKDVVFTVPSETGPTRQGAAPKTPDGKADVTPLAIPASPRQKELGEQLQFAQARLAELRSKYGASHPSVLQAEQTAKTLESEIREESGLPASRPAILPVAPATVPVLMESPELKALRRQKLEQAETRLQREEALYNAGVGSVTESLAARRDRDVAAAELAGDQLNVAEAQVTYADYMAKLQKRLFDAGRIGSKEYQDAITDLTRARMEYERAKADGKGHTK